VSTKVSPRFPLLLRGRYSYLRAIAFFPFGSRVPQQFNLKAGKDGPLIHGHWERPQSGPSFYLPFRFFPSDAFLLGTFAAALVAFVAMFNGV